MKYPKNDILFEKLMYRVSILMYVIGIENMNKVSVSELMPFRKRLP